MAVNISKHELQKLEQLSLERYGRPLLACTLGEAMRLVVVDVGIAAKLLFGKPLETLTTCERRHIDDLASRWSMLH